LTQAFAINDSGWITGVGINPQGNEHGYVLVPVPEPVPEPSTYVALGGLLVMGLIGYGWRRRGKQAH
jgi:hypothetical protein